jgi:hypothetical protein
VVGFGVDQELLYLRHEGFRYEPDLVMAYVAHFRNSRHMNTRRWGKKKPRFKLVGGDLVLTNSPVVEETPEIASSTPLPRLDGWCARHSQLYDVLSGGLLWLAGHPRGVEAQENLQDGRDQRNPAFKRELFELGVALIQAMHDESAARGVPFVLVTEMDDVHDAAVARRILSLNVRGLLADPRLELPNGLSHINERGNRLLAGVIEDYLRSRRLIPARHLEPVSFLPRVR